MEDGVTEARTQFLTPTSNEELSNNVKKKALTLTQEAWGVGLWLYGYIGEHGLYLVDKLSTLM